MKPARDLFGYPDVPAARATDTSRDAADAIAPQASQLRGLVLDAIRGSGGLTADEVARRLKRSPLAVRPRVTELHRQGAIADSGQRRKNRSGLRAIVWTATGSTP